MTRANTPALTCLLSVVLSDDGGSGHNLPYARAAGEAARTMGWEHLGLVPDSVAADQVPKQWWRGLKSWDGHAKRSTRIRSTFALAGSIRRGIQAALGTRKDNVVLFVDSFSVLKLLALLLACMRLPRKRVRIWVIYRYDYDTRRGELAAYRWINRAFVLRLGRDHFQLLTDSEPLRIRLRKVFGHDLAVMPVPHTIFDLPPPLPKDRDEIICWWPGKANPNKGLALIQRLTKISDEDAHRFAILAAEDSCLHQIPGGARVQLLPNSLSPEEYFQWMATADVVLLPYDPVFFHRRTSGIFIESVVAGKMPMVTEGTWMSTELAAWGLSDLVIAWEAPAVFRQIRELLHNSEVRARLQRMSDGYRQKHSISGYAQKLREIVLSGRVTDEDSARQSPQVPKLLV